VKPIATGWRTTSERNRAVGFIDSLLRGASQVMLQDNPLTGLLFLAGITWGAVDAGTTEVAVGALVALVVSTATAMLLGADEASVRAGLYGFNGVLVGVAVPSFLDVDARVWAYLVIGAAVSTVVMMAVANVFKTWDVPALTFPFVLTTWFLALASHSFANVRAGSLPLPSLADGVSAGAADVEVTLSVFVETLFRSVSQVFLLDNVAVGVVFVAALAVSSRWSALCAVLASAVAFGAALVLGATGSEVTAGLFGFSAVLTGIALGSVFYRPGLRVFAYAALAVVFTVIVTGALDAALSPVGVPTFTAPFVFVTWLFLIPKEKFVPIGHTMIRHHVAGGRGAPPAAPDSSGEVRR
jgi:urea transporter